MPGRRPPSSSPADPIDGAISLLGLLFGGGRGGTSRVALLTGALLILLCVATFGWYLFQPASRKQEIARGVAHYSQQHKRITLGELLWDVWTQYIRRPFVPTAVRGGEAIVFGGEPQRGAFPYEVRTLYNTAYEVGYCDDLDNPVWSAYRVFDVDKDVKPPRRPSSFFVDPRTLARVEPGDYVGSGYDRGHMTPNYAIGTRYGHAAQEETFKMSNVCPQRHRLNAGLWKDLETRIVDNYTGRYGQVWVIDGPIFGPLDRLQRINNKVPVPLAFYMIIVQQHEGGVRDEAFIMKQETPAHGALDPYLTSVGEIEHRTGLHFFPQLEKPVQAALEAANATSAW